MDKDILSLKIQGVYKQIALVFAAIILVSCGGGSESGSSELVEPEEVTSTDGDTDSTGSTDEDESVGSDSDNSDSDNQEAGDAAVEPDSSTDGSTGESSDTQTNESDSTGRRARLVVKEQGSFVEGTESIFSIGTPLVNRSGDVAVKSIRFESVCCERIDEVLAGDVFSPLERVIQVGDAVDGLAPSVRISAVNEVYMGPEGRVLASVIMDGSRSFSSLVESKDGVVTALFSEGDSITVPGDPSATLGRLSSADHSGDQMAFIVPVSSFRPTALFVDSGEGPRFVTVSSDTFSLSEQQRLQVLPVLSDGCRVSFDQRGKYALDSSGVLYFDSVLDAETSAANNDGVCARRGVVKDEFATQTRQRIIGDDTSSIMMYTAQGGFSELLSAGFAVPGMDNAVFVEVSIRNVSDAGQILARAVIAKPSTGETFDSRWVVSAVGEPRLVALEGETFQSALGDSPVSYEGDPPSSFNQEGVAESLLVADDGYVSSTYGTSIISGYPHPPVSPYSSLPVSGSSPLVAIATEGGAAFPGFADSAFVSSVGEARAFDGGTVIFSASVNDVDDESASESGIWLRDASAEPKKLFTPGEVIETDTVPVRIEGLRDIPMIIDDNWVVLKYNGNTSRSSGLIVVPLER